MLYDMHCHLPLMANAVEVALDAEAAGLGMFACTCEPAEFTSAQMGLGAYDKLRIGVGLHPWWIRDGKCGLEEAKLLAERAAGERFIGEVGLDFSKKGLGEMNPDGVKEVQLKTFRMLCTALAENPLPGRVISIHAVQSVDVVLDELEQAGLIAVSGEDAPVVILHWFSGSSDELARARKLGCYFSVSELMMRSRRGREYARQIPLNRLLLETDAPPQLNAPYSAQEIIDSLNRTLDQLAELRRSDRAELANTIARTSAELLGLTL